MNYFNLSDPWNSGRGGNINSGGFKGHETERPKRGFAIRACKVRPENDCPRTIQEAKDSQDWELWRQAIESELEAHKKNGTFTLGKPPRDRTVLPTRWVFTIKKGASGEIVKYKARWVCKGFRQEEGVDYDETFASVVKAMIAKALLALAAKYDYEVEQMDVITAFLEAHLQEAVWVEQPPDYEEIEMDGAILACLLNKALYGLKQAPREW